MTTARISGTQLRQWLVAANLSQADLARRLHLDAGQVSRWCTDKAPLRGALAAAVVDLLRRAGVHAELAQPGGGVFLATPMASLSEDDYRAERAAGAAVHQELRRIAAPVYWAAAQIDTADRFEAPDLAAERNLAALHDADAFVYLQLRDLDRPTSCHIELGIALARSVPVTVFAPAEEALPYMLRHFEAVAGRAGIGGRYRFYPAQSAGDAVRLLAIHGPALLGLPARAGHQIPAAA